MIRSPYGETEPFEAKAEVLQGDPLALFQFIVFFCMKSKQSQEEKEAGKVGYKIE